jgi:signal peptidase I
MLRIIKDLLPYAIILIVVILIRSFIITPVRVDGDSMKKNLNDGDILLLYKLGSIKRNDIVVINYEEDDEIIIKRVIGLPNETVEIKNNTIYINGEKIDNSYAYGETSDYSKITLGSDEYFVLGDNRLISKDSRIIGPVKKDAIKGKAIIRIFPFTKIGTV